MTLNSEALLGYSVKKKKKEKSLPSPVSQAPRSSQMEPLL